MNTLFQQHKRRLYTWTSPDGWHRNQTDDILCSQRWRGSILTSPLYLADHLTCLLINEYAGQEATVRSGHGTTEWFQIGKGVHQGCILSPCLFNLFRVQLNWTCWNLIWCILIGLGNIHHYNYFHLFLLMFFPMLLLSSVQSLSHLWLCNPVNRSTPGLPVHHQLPEFTQTHVHRVSDAIQPSHPVSSPSPSALNPSQHQGFFQWVNSSHEVAKVLEFQLQHQSFQWTPRTDLL